MTLQNKVYDFLKSMVLIWIPAIGALYFALAGIWGLPDASLVTGSITALETFLGTTLHISSSSYKGSNDGQLVVDKSNPAKDVYSLELTTPFEELDNKKTITLQVKS